MGNRPAPDWMVAQIAQRQHGAISIGQLHAAGLSNSAVTKRCRAGRLHRLHRGVYAVGHIAPSFERTWVSAVLALGDDAVLSHRSAAALWTLLPAIDGPVDVSVPRRSGRRSRRGIRVHRPLALGKEERVRRLGIPVTAPARTLRDLRATTSPGEFRRAVRQADVLGLATGADIVPDRTRSELERRFLWLCGRARIPKPEVNVEIGAMTVDFCWRKEQVIVETDGYRYHRGRAAFEEDRGRGLRLRALGFEVLRVSHRQVFHEPGAVVQVVRQALIERSGAG